MIEKEKYWVYWEINSLAYNGVIFFAEKSGITPDIRNHILFGQDDNFQMVQMSGVGELVASYNYEAGKWYCLSDKHSGVRFDVVPKVKQSVMYMIKCRNNRYILVNGIHFQPFEKVEEEKWWGDYQMGYDQEYADDVTPAPIFQTEDYVYWEADEEDYAIAYTEEGDRLGSFNLCRGQIIERFYYSHIFSQMYLDNSIEFYCEETGDWSIDYVLEGYEGWVYGIATKSNGINYILWSPEENIGELPIDEIYQPYLNFATENPEDLLLVNLNKLSEINQMKGKNIDMLLMPLFYESNYLQHDEYEQIPF
jgi:hypothetical protein